MEFTGLVQLVSDVETVGKNNTTKQYLVIKEDKADYPQSMTVDFLWDKTALLSGIKAGDLVTVHLNIDTNEYNGKYYNRIKGWKIDKGATSSDDDVL